MSKPIKGIRIGDRVEITTRPWLGQIGFVEHINGGYNYIRLKGIDPNKPNPEVLELYPNEFRVVERYEIDGFPVDQNVILLSPALLDWGRGKMRHGGVVIGACEDKVVIKTHAGRGRSRTFHLDRTHLALCAAPYVKPEPAKVCPHCGGELPRREPAGKKMRTKTARNS